MRKVKSDLLKKCQECMANPIADILENFSLEKSKFHYEKWAKQREMGDRYQNPADKHEEVSFAFASLDDLAVKSIEAHNLYTNIKAKEFFKGADWYMYWHNIVVSWHRLKSFDEWLHDWLKDALTQHYKDPENGIRKMLDKERWGWLYWNVDIHLWLEWKIDDEAMQRMGRYEPCQSIEGRDLEKDIEEAVKALKSGEKKEWDVTVLTLKV